MAKKNRDSPHKDTVFIVIYGVVQSAYIFFRNSEFFFLSIYGLHWVLPYHALNSEFANFETPCIKGNFSICTNLYPKGRIVIFLSLSTLPNIFVVFSSNAKDELMQLLVLDLSKYVKQSFQN
jgi:hypothetical protein